MDDAERIAHELIIEEANIWYISDDYGKKIIIKSPSTVVNAIVKGCRVDLLFGKDENSVFPYFHTGLCVYDDPIHFTKISGTHRFKFEHSSLFDIMSSEDVVIELYNELNIPFATAMLKLNAHDRKAVLALQGTIDNLYTGTFNQFASRSLDCFDYSIDKTRLLPNVYEISTLACACQFTDWQIANNIVVGYHGSNEFSSADTNIGELLEKQVLVPLENIFYHNIYRNAKIKDKHGFRELTDVFAFHEFGVFLIESKAIIINQVGQERSMERKIKGLQKQVKKAIDQLKGASKKIAAKTDIFDHRGKKIEFSTDKPPHCIVLVSDLLPFGDWQEILMYMFQAMIDQPMFLHLMDLTDLMTYIGHSKGRSEMFDYFLLERSDQLVENKNIFIKASRSNSSTISSKN